MVEIERLVNFPVSSNCYIIAKTGNNECILVDPAQEEGGPLHAYLSEKGLRPEYIILTHEHFDHISAVELLRKIYNSKVIASAACSQRITNPKTNLSVFYDQKGFSCSPADIIIDKSNLCISWQNIPVKFYETPGHSEGGLCFNIENNLFTGDTFLKDIKAVTKLPGSSKEKLENSIKMLSGLFGENTMVYPGHGEVFKFLEGHLTVNK